MKSVMSFFPRDLAQLPGVMLAISHQSCESYLHRIISILSLSNLIFVHSMGLGWELGFIQPGPDHFNQRKLLRRAIGPQGIENHNNIIESSVQQCMAELATFQGNPNSVIERYVTGFTLPYVIPLHLLM
jgi:cytochrome P450